MRPSRHWCLFAVFTVAATAACASSFVHAASQQDARPASSPGLDLDTETRIQRRLIEGAIHYAILEQLRPSELPPPLDYAHTTAEQRAMIFGLGFQAVPNSPLCGTLSTEEEMELRRQATLMKDPKPELTDVGIELLVSEDFGLVGLKALSIADYPVTDRGMAALAAGTSRLNQLESLEVFGTQITDAGVRELARSGSCLKKLRTLSGNFNKNVTPNGLHVLADPDTGLVNLEFLDIGWFLIDDECIREFARPDSGLKNLKALCLSSQKVTAEGVKQLARPDSGLHSLVFLGMDVLQSTDAALKEIVRPDSGLRTLEFLALTGPGITDTGINELVRADSGLKQLKRVVLLETGVSSPSLQLLKLRWPEPADFSEVFPQYTWQFFRDDQIFTILRGRGPKTEFDYDR